MGGRTDISNQALEQGQDPVGDQLDAIFLASVPPVAFYLAALFAFFAVLHPLLLPSRDAIIMTAAAVMSAACSVAIGMGTRANRIDVRHAYAAGFAIFALGLSNSALHMWIMRDIDQSTNFALVLVSVGLFFLSRRYLAVAYSIVALVWASLTLSIYDTEHELGHFAIMNLQAMAIGILAQTLRVAVHRRLLRMQHEAGAREQKLSEALSQARLYAAAERENKAKTEFLANMSHELRTPLNAILGFSEIMSQEMFGPLGNKKYTEYTGNIIDAGRHLLSLVNDILDLSRIELDTGSLVRQPIDIEAACRNCISIVRERAERGGIDLRLRVPRSMPAIQSDNRRLKQILINLLTNAIKFTPPGGSVSLDVEEDKSGYALFRIRDTGIGMSTEEIGKAGHPFWQADAGLDRTYEGTGLGLALVTKLASAMEGEFWLESTPGKGTTASLRLPCRPSAAVAAA